MAEARSPQYPSHISSSLVSNRVYRPQKSPIPANLFSTRERPARSGPADRPARSGPADRPARSGRAASRVAETPSWQQGVRVAWLDRVGKRVASGGVAALVAGHEPSLALSCGAVRPGVGVHLTAGRLLDPVVTDGLRRIDGIADLRLGQRLEELGGRGVVRPDPGEAVRLEFRADRSALGARPATAIGPRSFGLPPNRAYARRRTSPIAPPPPTAIPPRPPMPRRSLIWPGSRLALGSNVMVEPHTGIDTTSLVRGGPSRDVAPVAGEPRNDVTDGVDLATGYDAFPGWPGRCPPADVLGSQHPRPEHSNVARRALAPRIPVTPRHRTGPATATPEGSARASHSTEQTDSLGECGALAASPGSPRARRPVSFAACPVRLGRAETARYRR